MNLSPADEKTILLAVSLLICTATVSIASLPPASTTTLEHETLLHLFTKTIRTKAGRLKDSMLRINQH